LLFDLGPQMGRLALDEAQAGQVRKLPVDIEELTIEDGPSEQVSLRTLRPQHAPAMLPTIVYIHGAGWVFGSKQTHDRLMRELVVGARAAVVFPEYRLSPEAKYPTAIEECYSVVKWVAACGRERGGPDIRLQLLFYPVTDAAFDTASYHQFAEGYHLRRDDVVLGSVHAQPGRAQ
jgi:acetyl esterase/lipase